MNRIEELLVRLCPNGVEYRALGEVGTFTRGSGIQKKDFVETGKPCIHYGQIYTRFGMTTNKALSMIPEKQYACSKMAFPDDVVIAITSENVEDEPVAISGHSCAYHTELPSCATMR